MLSGVWLYFYIGDPVGPRKDRCGQLFCGLALRDPTREAPCLERPGHTSLPPSPLSLLGLGCSSSPALYRPQGRLLSQKMGL